MKTLVLLALAAVVVAKPSGVLVPHSGAIISAVSPGFIAAAPLEVNGEGKAHIEAKQAVEAKAITTPALEAHAAIISGPTRIEAKATIPSAIVSPIGHIATYSNLYHAQDTLGQYAFGYSSPLSSKEEIKTADGITRGGYSYLDAEGKIQSVAYTSDANGFHVAATNLPVAPSSAPVPVADTLEIVAAKSAHLAAHEQVKAHAAHVNAIEARQFQNFVTAPVSSSSYYYIIYPYPTVTVSEVAAPLRLLPVVRPTFAVEYASPDAASEAKVLVESEAHPAAAVATASAYLTGTPGAALTPAGVPVDTPEVTAARARHLAAVEAEKQKSEW